MQDGRKEDRHVSSHCSLLKDLFVYQYILDMYKYSKSPTYENFK